MRPWAKFQVGINVKYPRALCSIDRTGARRSALVAASTAGEARPLAEIDPD
jgi:hypothetical protein